MAQTVDEYGFPIGSPDAASATAAPALTAPGSTLPTDEYGYPIARPPAASGTEQPFPPPASTLPGFIAHDPGGAVGRIAGAAAEGYYGAPDILTPEAQAVVDKWGVVPAFVSRLPGTALGLASGAYRGAQQFGKEILSDIDPKLASDVVSVPDAFAGSPHALDLPRDVPHPLTPPLPVRMIPGAQPYSAPGLNLLAGGVEPVMPDITAGAVDRAGPTSAVPQLGPNAPSPGRAPTTPAEAKAVANAHYDTAPQTDSGLTSQFNQKLVDAISPARETESLVGKNDATDLVEKLRARVDQPLTIRGVQEQDEDMTQLVEKHRDPVTGKLDKVGQQIDEMQDAFRDRIDKAGPGDTTGGPAGFDALDSARGAWSQYRKMDDVQRMWDVSQTRKVPQTAFENRVGTYLNSKKAAGWTDEEKASLADAAKNGMTSNLMHLLGNKLIAAITGPLAGSKWGYTGLVAGEAISQGVASGARSLENAMVANRIARTQSLLGQRVPPTPLLPPGTPIGSASVPPPSTVPYWAAPLLSSTQQPPAPRNWLQP